MFRCAKYYVILSNMKRIAVVLSGCGFKDGSEITESVSTLISLSEENVEYTIFAPDIKVKSVHHISGQVESERSILAESARIARGQIQNVKNLKSADFNGVIFPGGYGAAFHLCDFAQNGAKCFVLPEIQRVIEDFHKNEKPIGAFCIAPMYEAKPNDVFLGIRRAIHEIVALA